MPRRLNVGAIGLMNPHVTVLSSARPQAVRNLLLDSHHLGRCQNLCETVIASRDATLHAGGDNRVTIFLGRVDNHGFEPRLAFVIGRCCKIMSCRLPMRKGASGLCSCRLCEGTVLAWQQVERAHAPTRSGSPQIIGGVNASSRGQLNSCFESYLDRRASLPGICEPQA